MKIMCESLESLNIKKRIEELRIVLQELIEKKTDIVDPEIVMASEVLDTLINKYNNLYNKA
jgi:hypothetical protein